MQRRKVISSLIFILSVLSFGTFIHKATVAVYSDFSIATVVVNPQTSVGTIGQNFTINVNISNVIDLYGWEFKLAWDPALLDGVNVKEGPFLKDWGETFFSFKINNTLGYSLVDCALLGFRPGVSGNGTLAIIEFYVETVGECSLDLYDTILINPGEFPIVHTTADGYYYTSVHDVAIINLIATGSAIDVTVENQGTHTETFNVSTFYTLLTDPLIGTQTVTLQPGTNTTLTFPWTPPSSGNYEIRAEANIVPSETDQADNIRTATLLILSGALGTSGCGKT